MSSLPGERAALAMELAENQRVNERFAAGKSVRWASWREGTFWKFQAGPYRIVRWTVDDRGNRISQYMAAYKGVVLGGQEPYRSLNECKRLCADHARLCCVRKGAGS